MEDFVKVIWPDGQASYEKPGTSWLEAAFEKNIRIPTGCLGGSCGACEIEVNGKIVRSCVNCIQPTSAASIQVLFAEDPYW